MTYTRATPATSSDPARPSDAITVVKLGGELLETEERLAGLAHALVGLSREAPLVVVHGGGREINKELELRGVPRRTVDGLRITDAATLRVVVSVLAGLVNTRLVAAMGAVGGRPVGLTGADDGIGLVEPADPHRDRTGHLVDLELVGQPIGRNSPPLIADLLDRHYTPVLASIGVDATGRLFNVNADTLAAHLAVRVGAARLLIAGTTPGVLDAAGSTIERLAIDSIARRVASGEVHGGMAAKLTACVHAVEGDVGRVVILDGRDPNGLRTPRGTLIELSATPGSGTTPGRPGPAAPTRRSPER